MANPLDLEPKSVGRGNITSQGWSVEARAVGKPMQVGEYLLGERWQKIDFPRSVNIGVPIGSRHEQARLAERGLLAYASAEALRWWLTAIAHIEHPFVSLETRLVKHEIKESHEVRSLSAHAWISGDNRSSIMPDWGEPKGAAPAQPGDSHG